ncbi:MAG: cyclase family protein [Xanthobacteraceae bacterium]|nr:cyclase family protein [Xanthobacteraceae bacterium]MBY0613009.1 cyclase family protein [Beijerinckiaceae bacterium]
MCDICLDRRRLLLGAATVGAGLVANTQAASSQAKAIPPEPQWASVVGEGWQTFRFGPDDEVGAPNLITPTVTLAALQLVKTGRVLRLGLDLNGKSPGTPPRKFEHYLVQNIGSRFNNNDDFIHASLNTGTQIDGLGHMGVDGVFYNGHRWQDIAAMEGLSKLGAEHIPLMVTRGVLLDMVKLKGRRFRGGEVITIAETQAALAQIGVEVRAGDIVLFHTGWLDLWRAGDDAFWKSQPGPGIEVANFLCAAGVAGIGADNSRLEADPHERPDVFFPVHQILLAKHGAHVLENWNTQVLVDAGATEFCLVVAPLPISGASQTWVNPLVIL